MISLVQSIQEEARSSKEENKKDIFQISCLKRYHKI